MEKCVIILPTHSSYIDICENFLELLRKNWKECNYRIVVSVCGEDKNISGVDYLYNESTLSITQCLVNACLKYEAATYLVFLGDAFILKKVDNSKVLAFLDEFDKYKIEYCRLYSQFVRYKKIMVGSTMRKMKSARYSMSFVAFAATNDFIMTEFGHGESDIDFEVKYLEIADNTQGRVFYDKKTMLSSNFLHILPGIEKGKWERLALFRLKWNNPEIIFSNREKISIKWQLYLIVRKIYLKLVPAKIGIETKKILKRMSFNVFSTDK